MQYTTLSSLKNKLWIATTDSDLELNSIIDEATQLIDNEIWFNLETRIITERVDWTWVNKLFLKNKTNSIIKISWINELYEVDFIEWYIIYLKQKTLKWSKNIIVEYEVWFDNPPKDIESICLDICFILCDKQNIKWSNLNKLTQKVLLKN
jgi:hypothetical protein